MSGGTPPPNTLFERIQQRGLPVARPVKAYTGWTAGVLHHFQSNHNKCSLLTMHGEYLTRSQPRPPGKQRFNPTLTLIRQQGTSLVFLNHIDPIAGVLACLDGYMNIAMEQTEEYVNGQLKNKYGDCFIRGNNGESILRPTLIRIFCQGRQVGPV